jgi:AraC family transcriptional regulator
MESLRLRLSASTYPAGTRLPPHAHDELQLSLVLHGSVAERVASITEHAGPLSVVAKDPCVTHADEFGGTGALMARLSIPNHGLADLVDEEVRVSAWRWRHDADVATPFLRLIARAECGTTWFAADDGDVLDLIAALTARGVTSAGRGAPRWLQMVMQQMCEKWQPRLTVRAVARGGRAPGVSRPLRPSLVRHRGR